MFGFSFCGEVNVPIRVNRGNNFVSGCTFLKKIAFPTITINLKSLSSVQSMAEIDADISHGQRHPHLRTSRAVRPSRSEATRGTTVTKGSGFIFRLSST